MNGNGYWIAALVIVILVGAIGFMLPPDKPGKTSIPNRTERRYPRKTRKDQKKSRAPESSFQKKERQERPTDKRAVLVNRRH